MLAAPTGPAVAGTGAEEGSGSGYDAAIANGQSGRPTALVAIASSGGGTPWCSATVIAPTAVLTAGHCAIGRSASSIEVVLPGGRVPVASVHLHPAYDRVGSLLDVAVLRTTGVVVGPGVRAADLPEPGDVASGAAGAVLRAAGYGCSAELLGPGGSITCVGRGSARFVDMPVRTAPECERALAELGLAGFRADAQLCAGGWSSDGSSADTCRGDSGGPLLSVRPGGRDLVVGVVSFGASRCGWAPGFFTRVSAATVWIRSVMGPTTATGYWLLTETGEVLGFGDAAGVAGAATTLVPFSDAPVARAVDLTPTAGAVVVLRADGTVVGLPTGTQRLGDGRWAALAAGGDSVLAATSDGRVVTVSGSAGLVWSPGVRLQAPVIDAVATASGRGAWLLGADGGVFAIGDAAFHGSMGGRPLNAPIVGIAPTPSGAGYWLVAADGGVFAFGDAVFRGSMGGRPLNAPVVGLAPYGNGYALVGADGGVFVFSDLPFQGSLGDRPPANAVVALAPLQA